VTASEFLKEIEIAVLDKSLATTATHIVAVSTQSVSTGFKCVVKQPSEESKTDAVAVEETAVVMSGSSRDESPSSSSTSSATSASSIKGTFSSPEVCRLAQEVTSPATLPNSKSVYEKLIMQQCTPLKNQIETSQKHSFKAKKFGNLFKLQSIRSAKVQLIVYNTFY
jgi:hypothetical protein